MQLRASVRLSEIARSLEEGVRLKKVVERLSRQLNRKGLRQRVLWNLLKMAAPRVGRETLLGVGSDGHEHAVCAPDGVSGPGARRFSGTTAGRVLVLPGGRGGAGQCRGDAVGQVVLTHFRGPLLLPFTLGVATKVGQLHLRRLLFVAIRRHVAQRRVPAPPVVESLNEVEDGSSRLVRIPELVTVQQLALDRREAEFAGVVPSEYAA